MVRTLAGIRRTHGTARWALFAHGPAGLLRADIHHERWLMHDVEILELDDEFASAAGYDVAGRMPDHVAFSPGVDVRVAMPTRLAPLKRHLREGGVVLSREGGVVLSRETRMGERMTVFDTRIETALSHQRDEFVAASWVPP